MVRPSELRQDPGGSPPASGGPALPCCGVRPNQQRLQHRVRDAAAPGDGVFQPSSLSSPPTLQGRSRLSQVHTRPEGPLEALEALEPLEKPLKTGALTPPARRRSSLVHCTGCANCDGS